MKSYVKMLALLLPAILLKACGDGVNFSESTTRGKIKLGVDDSFTPLMNDQIDVFKDTYTYATIEAVAGDEDSLMYMMLNDSIRGAVVGRDLNEQERNFLASKKIVPKSYEIAIDGITFILNRTNADSQLTYRQLQKLFSPTQAPLSWSELSPSNQSLAGQPVLVVFDHPRSSNARFLKDKFALEKLPPHCYAQRNNKDVVEYVKSTPNAIGVIGVNWISDKTDSVSNKFLSEIRVAAISSENDPEGERGFYKPLQGHLALKEYPFDRKVFIHLNEPFAGLGTGFASFLTKDRGQRIVRLSGMLPAQVPIRIVETQ